MTNFKKLELMNPYQHLSKLFGYLFWPLTLIPWVKRDILPILKLVNKLFVNSKVAPFIAFWYPFILVSILGRVGSPHFIMTGIVSIVPIIIGIQVMPTSIILLRNSSVLKRIGATNTKTSDISTAIIFYFTIVSIVSTVFNCGLGYVIYHSNIHFRLFNWGHYIIANLIGIMIAMSFGMFVSSFLKREQTALLVGLLLTLPGAFLSAQFLSPSIVNNWGIARYVSFIFPQKIVVVLSYAATNNHSIFEISNVMSTDFHALSKATETINNIKASITATGTELAPEQLAFYDDWLAKFNNRFEVVDQTEMLLAWIFAPIQIVGFSVLSTLLFKWGIR